MDAIAVAAAAGADVVVLPELAVSGYVFSGPEEARALAEALERPTVTAWRALAERHGLVIVGGLCERDADGEVRNTAVLVDRHGLQAVYRKAHLWDREGRVFVAGSEPPPAVDTEHGRIGLMVCYDLEFPEWVRLAAFAGVELLCAPVNWPLAPRPDGERGVDWVGGSLIVDPDGFPLAGPARADEVVTVLARCALGEARDKCVGQHNDVLADRRPELYADVALAD